MSYRRQTFDGVCLFVVKFALHFRPRNTRVTGCLPTCQQTTHSRPSSSRLARCQRSMIKLSNMRVRAAHAYLDRAEDVFLLHVKVGFVELVLPATIPQVQHHVSQEPDRTETHKTTKQKLKRSAFHRVTYIEQNKAAPPGTTQENRGRRARSVRGNGDPETFMDAGDKQLVQAREQYNYYWYDIQTTTTVILETARTVKSPRQEIVQSANLRSSAKERRKGTTTISAATA